MVNSRHISLLRYDGSPVGAVKNAAMDGVQNLSPHSPRYYCKIKSGLWPGNEANKHPIAYGAW